MAAWQLPTHVCEVGQLKRPILGLVFLAGRTICSFSFPITSSLPSTVEPWQTERLREWGECVRVYVYVWLSVWDNKASSSGELALNSLQSQVRNDVYQLIKQISLFWSLQVLWPIVTGLGLLLSKKSFFSFFLLPRRQTSLRNNSALKLCFFLVNATPRSSFFLQETLISFVINGILSPLEAWKKRKPSPSAGLETYFPFIISEGKNLFLTAALPGRSQSGWVIAIVCQPWSTISKWP